MIRLTEEADTFQLWFQIYVEGCFQDPHTKFSEFLGITRMEAKSRAYKIAYSIKKDCVLMNGFRDAL